MVYNRVRTSVKHIEFTSNTDPLTMHIFLISFDTNIVNSYNQARNILNFSQYVVDNSNHNENSMTC